MWAWDGDKLCISRFAFDTTACFWHHDMRHFPPAMHARRWLSCITHGSIVSAWHQYAQGTSGLSDTFMLPLSGCFCFSQGPQEICVATEFFYNLCRKPHRTCSRMVWLHPTQKARLPQIQTLPGPPHCRQPQTRTVRYLARPRREHSVLFSKPA